MKKIIILIVLFSSLVKAETFNINDEDKKKHVAASFLITTASYYGYNKVFKISKKNSLLLAIGTSLLIGTIKELNDKEYSQEDLKADTIGTFSGVIIPLTFSF